VLLLYLAHYLVFSWFLFSEAAISISYARNLVSGQGLVAFAGGERVEGFSNPLWVLLIAIPLAVGIPGWLSVKLMGALFGCGTLLVVARLARRLRGKDDLLSLAPAALLACCTQFVVWNASGLENPLFGLLLMAALLCTVRELEEGGRPWSAGLFALLALTRPEAAMYGLLGAGAQVFRALRDRRLRPLLLWLAVFLAPVGAYLAWRMHYFAWPLPTAYYAKIDGMRFRPFSWEVRGWGYLHRYLADTLLRYALPLAVLSLCGRRGWRAAAAIGLLTGLALFSGVDMLWHSALTIRLRVLWILVGAPLLGLLALGRPGGAGRLLCWLSCCAAFFFMLYTGGDWAQGHRWGNLLAPPLFLLLGLGVGELADGLRNLRGAPWLRRIPVAAALLMVALPNTWLSWEFLWRPELGVRSVVRFVRAERAIQRRLHLDRVQVLSESGAGVMYATNWELMDVTGLMDVPFAQQRYDPAFLQEYVLKENRPDIVMIGEGWLRKAGLRKIPGFLERYGRVPLQLSGDYQRETNFVDKRHWVASRCPVAAEPVAFEGGVVLEGWQLPSPEVAKESAFFLQTCFRNPEARAFRLLAFAAGSEGGQAAWEIQPGYGWYPPQSWGQDERVFSGHDLPLSAALAPGAYRIGLVLLDEASGRVLAAQDPGEPLYMMGEALLPAQLRIVSSEAALAPARRDHERALALAEEGACDAAWQAWRDARRHVLGQESWERERDPTMRSAMAACLSARAAAVAEVGRQLELLLEARRWDHRCPQLLAQALPLADRLEAEGQGHLQRQDWEAAYRAFSKAVALNPRKSWSRRHAEEIRMRRFE